MAPRGARGGPQALQLRRAASVSRNSRSSEPLTHQNPDLVCISQGGFSDGVEWMLLCRKMSLPYVVVAHANAESWWPHDQAGAELSFAYESARQSFFVAKRNLELFEAQTGSKLHNAKVVRNPFNVQI